MPNNLSAEKRVRQNEKRRLANKSRKTELKTIRKQFLRAVHDHKPDEAEQLLRRFSKRVDQAAARHVMHQNAASRAKSRLARQLAEAAKA